jgi:hypothetical protein
MLIKIRQSYHKKEQASYLDTSFIPMDNSVNQNPRLREYRFFLEHHQEGRHREADYSGIVSWKFNQKAKIEGGTFIDFIKNKPGYDVYFINPYPQEVYLFKNVWLQGESHHPGMLEFTQKIMRKLNYNIDLKNIENTHETALYCNFWVGNAVFWDEYMKFTQAIFHHLHDGLSDEERRFINQPADPARDATATYFSFIMERLFSTLLIYNKNIKALAYKYPFVELHIIQTLEDFHREAIQRIQQSQQTPKSFEAGQVKPELSLSTAVSELRVSTFRFWKALIKRSWGTNSR